MTKQPLTTASPSVTLPWAGGRGIVKADSLAWGGGTLNVKWCETSSGTAVTIGTGVSLTADGMTGLEAPKGFLVLSLDNSTAASVNVGVARTEN